MANYLAFEQLTVDSTSGGVKFTVSKTNPTATGGAAGSLQATVAVCRLEAAEIRYTVDGTAPTTTVGTLVEIGDVITITGNDVLGKFRAIRTGAVSGVLDCNYSQP